MKRDFFYPTAEQKEADGYADRSADRASTITSSDSVCVTSAGESKASQFHAIELISTFCNIMRRVIKKWGFLRITQETYVLLINNSGVIIHQSKRGKEFQSSILKIFP